MSNITQVLRAREGGAVKRVHTIPWIGEYTVAQHTFGMLTLLDILYPPEANRSRLVLNQHILWHDVHERWTGDVPAGLRYFKSDVREHFKLAEEEIIEKFKFPKVELGEDEEAWVRSLDQLEFWLSCHDQRALGNENVEPYITAVNTWFVENYKEIPDPVHEFWHEFEWERTSQVV